MFAALASAAALALDGPPSEPSDETRREVSRAVRAQLAECGLTPGGISARYEPELLIYAVTIGGRRSGISEEAIACVVGVEMENGYDIRFIDRGAQARFVDAARAESGRRFRAMGTRWLSARGRLADLPAYDPRSETVADFAAELEAFCGVGRGSALQVRGQDILLHSSALPEAGNSGPFLCLANSFAASNAPDLGLRLGLISGSAPDRGERE